jgi:hypothetical protein
MVSCDSLNWKVVYYHKSDTTVLLKVITDVHVNYNCNLEGNGVRFNIAKCKSTEILRLTVFTRFLSEP